ncbi:chromosomal replication initiator protein DnaA [Desulfobacula toluolica]|uniref:Chromosomal replication initiator protein DnaA n=1 Tax=Desulfobacula toluolica (strain DSM 7467 / Tol2) TaxID=651182 RepID=K0NHN7_DESTT|nr:chromosomal replication initiator protein DnaA [Desulfobacula toluolica]CCK80450.1 DnaA: chromosomal replication initiator protein [Desulfobacula toluolica Tol2]
MKNIESCWTEVKGRIKKTLPDHSYRMWIDPVELLDFDQDHLELSSPNDYFIKRLKDNYLLTFKEEFSKLGVDDIRIDFKVSSKKETGSGKNNKTSDTVSAIPLVANRSKQLELPGLQLKFNNGRMFKKGFTFDDFVVGDNSNFAYSASLSLAQGNINGSSILYLLSKTGLGKSHLSQAVGYHIIKNSQSKRVYYVTAEDFTNEMIFSLKNKTIEQFKEKFRRKCDVLILEDVHFLSGKDATQSELAVTLDYLLEADKKIIFSGCELPDEIPKLNDQLRSRLTLGLVTEIGKPDYSTRVRILKKKSKSFGCKIPNHVTEYIAQELSDDVRQLESGLFGVAAKGQLMGYNIDIELAKSVLANITNVKKRISIESIKKLVCKEFSLSEEDIVSPSRKKRIVKPRQMAIFLSKKYTDQPIKKIGTSFNRYHATAIYSINAVEKELKQKGVLFEQMNYLSKKIEAGKL